MNTDAQVKVNMKDLRDALRELKKLMVKGKPADPDWRNVQIAGKDHKLSLAIHNDSGIEIREIKLYPAHWKNPINCLDRITIDFKTLQRCVNLANKGMIYLDRSESGDLVFSQKGYVTRFKAKNATNWNRHTARLERIIILSNKLFGPGSPKTKFYRARLAALQAA